MALSWGLLAPRQAAAAYVYLDPGHGGRYSNANANGLREKTVNLQIALELRKQLSARGHRVGMTRATDRAVALSDRATWNWHSGLGWKFAPDGRTGYVGGIPKDDLQARCDMANRAGADVFISVHNNGSASRRSNGTETYASRRDPLGRSLSRYVQQAVAAETRLRDRGAMTADFYVIRWANMPAILVEGAFITNPRDAALLRRPWFRQRLARGIAIGVQRFLATDPFKPVYPRVEGENRYATATAASRVGWPSGAETVLVAPGTRWYDSLALAPLSRQMDAPVLFAARSVVPTPTLDEIKRLRPSQILVVGGADVLDDSVVSALASTDLTEGPAVRRIEGRDRYEVAVAVAREMTPSPTSVVLVPGNAPGHALTISPYAARVGAPILLVDPRGESSATINFLAEQPPGAIRQALTLGPAGSVPASLTQSAQTVRSFPGTSYWAVNADVLRNLHGTGNVRPFVTTPRYHYESVVAAALAAKAGQPLLLLDGRVMNARTREWIGQNRTRIGGFGVVGDERAVPYLADWMLRKAAF